MNRGVQKETCVPCTLFLEIHNVNGKHCSKAVAEHRRPDQRPAAEVERQSGRSGISIKPAQGFVDERFLASIRPHRGETVYRCREAEKISL
jgi:hypothetical protein